VALICSNAYALPNTEKKKEERAEFITQIDPKSEIKVIEVDTIKDLDNPKSLEDKFSYAYSYLLYLSTLSQNLDINAEYYAKGAIDAAEGKALFNEQEIVEIIQEMQQQMLNRAQKLQQIEADNNLEKAEEFLVENAKNKEVFETGSGLQYRVIREGLGKPPTVEDRVVVQYQIYTQDEVLLLKSDGAKNFELDSLVPGFIEGIELMNAGAKYRFFVHPRLAYGMEGTNDIPPNSLLIFDVELKQILNDPISLAI
jgi:FKBP-type peptidyl-prolyl cis-trans isomerase